jgi:hypothetical protein
LRASFVVLVLSYYAKNSDMNKGIFFSGQPVLAQLIKLIPGATLNRLIAHHRSDRYYKTFKTTDHLISMLYACFHNCTSIREVTTGLAASYNKLTHLGITRLPRRSTLCDANAKRPVDFFRDLYHELYRVYYTRLPDSPSKPSRENRLFIMDSSTISLFSDVMKGAGTYGMDGRRKGGVKAHVLLNASQDIPSLIYLSESARNDRIFMEKIDLKKGDLLVFDKGYNNFAQWQQWSDKGITWVTRIMDNQVYELINQKIITADQQQKGVCQDQQIFLGRGTGPDTKQINARLVSYYVPRLKKVFHYLTNNTRMNASTIAGIYEQRWQVEIFFKRLKQNNPLRYFLGDNENAVRIQLWCAFIKDLLIKIVKDQAKKRWSFSNISGMIRHHLMNYLNLLAFLNNPEKMDLAANYPQNKSTQISLFSP